MRILKFIVKSFLALLLLTLIAWALLIVTLQTKQGQDWAVRHLIGFLENSTQTPIHIGQFEFSYPFTVHLQDISIGEATHPMATLQEVKLSWAYSSLLQGRLVFPSLQATGINIFQLPQKNKNSISSPTPLLPFYIKIENVDIQKVYLAPEVVANLALPHEILELMQDSFWDIKGVISHNPFKNGIAAHLLATVHERTSAALLLSLGIDAQNHQMSLSFHFNRLSLHSLHESLPPAHLALYATGPFHTWQNQFQAGEFLEGHFKLSFESPKNHPPLAELIGTKTTLSSRYVLRSNEEIQLLDLKLDSPIGFIEGGAFIMAGYELRQGNFKGEINHIEHLSSLLGKKVEGKLLLEAHAAGPLSSPSLTLNIESPSLIMESQEVQNIHSSFQYKGLGGLLALAFDYRGIPCRLETSIGGDNQKRLIFSGLNFNTMHTHIEGNIACSTNDFIWEGTLQAHSENVAGLADFFNTKVSGEAQMKIDLKGIQEGEHKHQKIHMELTGNALHWTDWHANQLLLDVQLQAGEGEIQFAIQQIKTPAGEMEEIKGNSTINPSHIPWPFQIKGRGAWQQELFFEAQGAWSYRQNVLESQVEQLTGHFGPYPFQLMQSLLFSYSPNGMQLSHLFAKWGEAELKGEFNLDDQIIKGQFSTNTVPSYLFHFVAPELPLIGHATFLGHLHGTLKDPKAQLHIALHQMQITEDIFVQKPFIEGEIKLDLDNKGMRLNSELFGIGNAPLVITGTLPLTLNLDPPRLKIDQELPFELAFQAEGELDPYLHLLYNDTINLTGQAKIALKLSGPMQAPQIQGGIDIYQGAYESLKTGALFHNIQAHLEGDGSKVVLTQFSAHDNKNGFLTAGGSISLNRSQNFPFEFHIKPTNIFLVDSDYAAISASGPLNWTGNIKKSTLKGVLTLSQATIRLKDALPNQIKTIEVKYLNMPEGEHLPSYLEKKESSSAIDLEVKLKSPDRIVIEGNNLSSEWKGDLLVTGTLGDPLYNGDLHIAKGEYKLNGRVFNLSQGSIHFAGPLSKKTTLYVVASKDIDRIQAEIIVKGPVNKPAISFRSNPPLSQREVLSYILFNRGISDITPGQGDELTQSFMSLNSNEQTSRSNDFLSRVRNNIGIDRLDFAACDNQNKEFALQAGKYLTENIYVSINKSITDAASVAIEAKLHKNLKLQADQSFLGDDPAQFRMSLKWKKDY